MRNAGAMTLETAGLSPGRPRGQANDLNFVTGIAVPALASAADAGVEPW